MACMAKLKVINSHFIRFVRSCAVALERVPTYHRVQAIQGCADGEAAEARLSDRTVDDSFLAESI